MADLGQIITQPDGSELILTGAGWLPNNPDLEAASAAGAFGAAANAIARSLSFGLINPGNQEAEALISPIAERAGLALDIGLAATGVGGVAKALSTRGAAAAAAKLSSEALAGGGGGGGGMFRTSTGFIRRPSGVVPRVLQPSVAGLEAGVQTVPFARAALDWVTVANQRNLAVETGLAMRMNRGQVRAGNGFLDAETMAPVMSRIDEVYDSARDFVTSNAKAADIAKPAQDALDKGLITQRQFERWTSPDVDRGTAMLQMRSQLRRTGRSGNDIVRQEEAREIVSDIQEIITRLVDDVDFARELAATDLDYKIWQAVNSPGVLGKEGLPNPVSLRRSMARVFGRNAVVGGKRQNLPPRVQRLLTALDEWDKLGFQVPTSGTAERAAAGRFLLGIATGTGIAAGFGAAN